MQMRLLGELSGQPVYVAIPPGQAELFDQVSQAFHELVTQQELAIPADKTQRKCNRCGMTGHRSTNCRNGKTQKADIRSEYQKRRIEQVISEVETDKSVEEFIADMVKHRLNIVELELMFPRVKSWTIKQIYWSKRGKI